MPGRIFLRLQLCFSSIRGKGEPLETVQARGRKSMVGGHAAEGNLCMNFYAPQDGARRDIVLLLMLLIALFSLQLLQ